VTRGPYCRLQRKGPREVVRDRRTTLVVQCDNIEARIYGDATIVAGAWSYTMKPVQGDVSTRILDYLEAAIGQLFPATLLARIVTLEMQARRSDRV
jgi:hypothetical protein